MHNSPEKLPRHPSAGWDLRQLLHSPLRHPSEGWGLLRHGVLPEAIPAFAGMTKVGDGMTKVGAGMLKSGAAIALLALPLAACTPNDPTLGGAVKHNYAMQVIDPDPEYKGTPEEGGSGDKAEGAMERYRTDKVKKPQGIRTTSGISGGSGSGGGGR